MSSEFEKKTADWQSIKKGRFTAEKMMPFS